MRACVYIYIRQLSSFRAPRLWFIDLTVASCPILYNFLSLCPFVSGENGQNTRMLEVRHFRMIRNGRRRLLGAQSINCLSEYLSDERPKFALSFGISPMNGRNLDYRSRSFVIHLMDGRSSHSRSGSIRWMAEV